MLKLDLKDAFLTALVHRDFHEFLQFVWEGEVFQFTCFFWPGHSSLGYWCLTEGAIPVL